jgi:hypothetical protein
MTKVEGGALKMCQNLMLLTLLRCRVEAYSYPERSMTLLGH